MGGKAILLAGSCNFPWPSSPPAAKRLSAGSRRDRWRAARSLRSGRTDGIGAQEHVDGGLQVRLHAGVVRALAQAAGHARVQVALEQGEELAPGPVHVGQVE